MPLASEGHFPFSQQVASLPVVQGRGIWSTAIPILVSRVTAIFVLPMASTPVAHGTILYYRSPLFAVTHTKSGWFPPMELATSIQNQGVVQLSSTTVELDGGAYLFL